MEKGLINMKKIYERPTVEVVSTGAKCALLVGSPTQIGDGETPPVFDDEPIEHAPGFFFMDDLDEDDEY